MPLRIGNLVSLGRDREVKLRWKNPTQLDRFSGVTIVRNTSQYPQNETDGTVVYSGMDSEFIDNGLDNGILYYYSLFSYNSSFDYSKGVEIAAMPQKPRILKVPTDFPTIQSAIDAAVVYDTVMVEPGIYNESIEMKAGITLQSKAGSAVTTIVGVTTWETTGIICKDCTNIDNDTIIEGLTIIASDMSYNQARGIKISGNSSPIIRNNLIISETNWNNPYGIDVSAFSTSEPIIENNTIIVKGGAHFKFAIGSYGGNPTVRNNICVGDGSSQSYGVKVAHDAIPSIHEYNYYYNFKYAVAESLPLGTGEIHTNTVSPGFVDSDNGDYHLIFGSPAIDAGDPLEAFNDIFFPPSMGTERNDMGAYGGPHVFKLTPMPVLWNKLGSQEEIENSKFGPNGKIFIASSYFCEGVDFMPGKFGNGFTSCQGLGKSGVKFGPWKNINPNYDQAGTVEFWWKAPRDYNEGNSAPDEIFVSGLWCDPFMSIPFQLMYRWRESIYGIGGFDFQVHREDGGSYYLYTGKVAPFYAGEWVHVAFVWDMNGLPGHPEVFYGTYINGKYYPLVDSKNPSGTINYKMQKFDDAYFSMGYYDADHNNQQRGVIDNVIIWNHLKTDFSHKLRECPFGDFDEDGDIDDYDFQEFLTAYKSCRGDANFIPEADLDRDNCITINDYRILRNLIQTL